MSFLQIWFANVLYHPRESVSSENDAKTAKDSNTIEENAKTAKNSNTIEENTKTAKDLITIEENAKTAKDSNILCVDGGGEGLLPAFSRDPLREVVVLRENERSK